MTQLPILTAFTAAVPDKLTMSKDVFANSVYVYLEYFNTSFTPEMIAHRTAMNILSGEVQAASDSAGASATTATSTVNNKGAWSALTGTLNVPASVNHNGKIWVLNLNLADVALSTPSDINTDWTSTGISATNPTITGLKETSVAMPVNDINLATGNHFKKTITAATTLTISNIPATGNLIVFSLELTNGGAFLVTFPVINWEMPDGTYTTSIATYLAANAPRIAFKATGVDTLIFWVSDGLTIYGKFL